MDIKDIKAQLSITEVLAHYGLRPDKNDRLLCPFHPDTNPSLQVYPKTNTFCCFSSNCTAGTGDGTPWPKFGAGRKHPGLRLTAT